jgi:hypothetical protein
VDVVVGTCGRAGVRACGIHVFSKTNYIKHLYWKSL